MTIEIAILFSVITVTLSIAAFFLGRIKDAEDRGALKQRVVDLEVRADKTDAKMDRILEKLDLIGSKLSDLVTSHNHITSGNNNCAMEKL